MGSKLQRPTHTWVGKLTNSAATTPVIILRDNLAAAKLYIPAGYTSASVTFYTLSPSTGTYLQEYDDAGTPLSVVLQASSAVALPDTLFAATHLRIVTDADDSTADVGLVMRA